MRQLEHLVIIQNNTWPGHIPESALCLCNFKSFNGLVIVPGWSIELQCNPLAGVNYNSHFMTTALLCFSTGLSAAELITLDAEY